MLVGVDSGLRMRLSAKSSESSMNWPTWTKAAIWKLQENGLVEKFDVGQFMDDSLDFADNCYGEGKNI
jgi:hypothetical protein